MNTNICLTLLVLTCICACEDSACGLCCCGNKGRHILGDRDAEAFCRVPFYSEKARSCYLHRGEKVRWKESKKQNKLLMLKTGQTRTIYRIKVQIKPKAVREVGINSIDK